MAMETVICDELLQEIFHRLPPSSSSAVSLVSKRWLRLLRSSTLTLSLNISSHPRSFSSFLSSYPYLSSLSLSSTSSSDHLLRSISFSCPNLCYLRFLPSDSVSISSFVSLSVSCPRLTFLAVALSRPIVLNWLGRLRSLKELSIFINGSSREQFQSIQFNCPEEELLLQKNELNLMSLSISGMRAGDEEGFNWLWGNCKQLKRLKLSSCECAGDNSTFSTFITSLKDLQEVEFRTSRTIVDVVLLKLAENCVSLDSLLVYDGGSKQGLLQFIVRSRCKLRKLDLRLPLDLDDDHLIAMSENFTSLSSLVFQSCCLVTGEGLKAVSRRLSQVLDELSLINCDAVERESGLLTTIGQNLKNLKALDLSFNENLNDKELTSMLVSCRNLKQLNLRWCNKLTDAAVASLISCCKQLEIVDFVFCYRISAAAVELFVLKSMHLRQLHVEATKISVVARTWASNKCIQIVS